VHETPGTIEEVRALCESFGLAARVVPDVSGSLDGHVPEQYIGTSLGGAKLTDIEALGDALHTIAIGEHMRGAAELSSERTGVPSTVLPTLLGLRESDELIALLAEVSGVEVPPRIKRERSRLVDAMLDGHFHLSGKRVAVAADPDLLASLTRFFHGLGALVEVAIASTKNSPLLAELPCEQVVVGDLGDFEELAGRARCDLLVTHSHGNLASEALDIPLFRIGFPIFDRLGHQHRSLGGYVGTRELIYEVANELMGLIHEHKPEDFASAVPPTLVLDTRHDLP
jgi:nitrogenase molybdenum-iron protein NifN